MNKKIIILTSLLALVTVFMTNGVLHGAEEIDGIIEDINKTEYASPFKRSNLCSEILEQLMNLKRENRKSVFKALYKFMQEKVIFVAEDFERRDLLEKIWPKFQNDPSLQSYLFTTTLDRLEFPYNKERLVEDWWDKLPEKYRSDIFATYFEQKKSERENTLKKYAANLSPDTMDRCFSQLLENKSNSIQRELLNTFWDHLPEGRRFTLVSELFNYGANGSIVKKTSLPKEQDDLLPACPSLIKLKEFIETQPKKFIVPSKMTPKAQLESQREYTIPFPLKMLMATFFGGAMGYLHDRFSESPTPCALAAIGATLGAVAVQFGCKQLSGWLAKTRAINITKTWSGPKKHDILKSLKIQKI